MGRRQPITYQSISWRLRWDLYRRVWRISFGQQPTVWYRVKSLPSHHNARDQVVSLGTRPSSLCGRCNKKKEEKTNGRWESGWGERESKQDRKIQLKCEKVSNDAVMCGDDGGSIGASTYVHVAAGIFSSHKFAWPTNAARPNGIFQLYSMCFPSIVDDGQWHIISLMGDFTVHFPSN